MRLLLLGLRCFTDVLNSDTGPQRKKESSMLTRKRADEVLVAALTGAKIQLAPAETKEILLEILKVYQRDCTKKIDNVRFRELYPHDVVAFEDSRAHAEKQQHRTGTALEISHC